MAAGRLRITGSKKNAAPKDLRRVWSTVEVSLYTEGTNSAQVMTVTVATNQPASVTGPASVEDLLGYIDGFRQSCIQAVVLVGRIALGVLGDSLSISPRSRGPRQRSSS